MSVFDTVVSIQSRPLPVIILADVSGSMNEIGKLDSLKHALNNMISSFKDASSSSLEAEIYVSIITFGNQAANIILEPQSASEIAKDPSKMNVINKMQAIGNTPLGKALTSLVDLLENREIYPSRAYRPFIVLASDGKPNDLWQQPLDRLLNSERSKKANRLALAIGTDADESMLKKFVNNEEMPIFKASNAIEIQKFFKCVTMSAIKSSQSAKPGEIAPNDIISLSENVKELFDED